MPITLADAKNLSQDKLTNYVIDEFRKSPLLDAMVFDNTVKPQGGQSMTYTYNRVSTLPTAATRAINSEYTPQEAKTSQVTVNLAVFGGSFQIDRVIAEHEKQVMQNSAGATETAYETMTDTFQHKVETMQTAAQNFGIDVIGKF